MPPQLLPQALEHGELFAAATEQMGSAVAKVIALLAARGASRVPDACREAQWALRGAQDTGRPIARYAEDSALPPFMPRSLSEAARASTRTPRAVAPPGTCTS